MGSLQQILLGLACVVAAFGFGIYVNNYPTDVQHPFAQNDSENLETQPIGNVQSRLTDSHFDVVNRRPAPIATMRNPLKPRFSMPLDTHASVLPQNECELPPPSQLANLDPSKPDSSGLDPLATNQEPPNLAKINDVPDFSSIASEFRNDPIELPALGSMPSHSHPIAAPAEPSESVAPLKRLAHRIMANTLDPATTPHPSTVDIRENVGSLEGFSTEDFAPQLKDPFVGPPTISKPDSNSYLNEEPVDQLSRIPGYVNPASTNIESFDSPAPSAYQDQVVSKQIAPSRVYRGAMTVDSGNQRGNWQKSNRVRTMLPFGLTDEAKKRLVAIHSDAHSRISVNTTQFVEHVVQPDETLQSISIRYFGNPDYYLDIYLANRNKLKNPIDVSEGIFLRIPVYQ